MKKKKKNAKAQTIEEYLNSLSERERFRIDTLGLHAKYNSQLGILRLHANGAIRQLQELGPLARKGEQFTKSPEEQKQISKMGGDAKFSKGYDKFVQWVNKTGFDVNSHAGDSNQNFANALITFKFNGVIAPMKLAPKTADKYRKKYLSDPK